MKKLLIYLILIACFESFISATPGLLYKQKKISNHINISAKDEGFQQDDMNDEINSLNIFYIRYF